MQILRVEVPQFQVPQHYYTHLRPCGNHLGMRVAVVQEVAVLRVVVRYCGSNPRDQVVRSFLASYDDVGEETA